MGTYFNPGNHSFTRAVKSSIYLDKTGLLEELNMLIGTEDNCIALSHARRFGKSQAAGMLDAYYSLGCDSEELQEEVSGLCEKYSLDEDSIRGWYNGYLIRIGFE